MPCLYQPIRQNNSIMTKQFNLKRDSKYFIPSIATLLALLTSVSPMATDTYLPAIPTMAEFFGVHISQIELSLSFYFIGVAVGQFLGGPISDSFGRKTVALIGVSLFGISSLCILFIKDVELLWLFRFTQAVGGGMASVVNMAFVRDWFEGSEIARLSSLITMIMMLAPLAAPLIGSGLLLSQGWHSIFVFMVILAVFVMLMFAFLVPESRPTEAITRKVTAKQFLNSYTKVFSHKEVIFLVLTSSFSISGMFAFITGASFIYIEHFKISVGQFPFFFGANVALNIILNILNFKLVKKIHPSKLLFIGLLIQLISGITLGVFSLNADVTVWTIATLIVLYVGSLGLVFANLVTLIIHRFPDISGSANAVIGVSRFAMSAFVGFIAASFHTNDLRSTCIAMAVCTVLGMVFYLISKRFRTSESL